MLNDENISPYKKRPVGRPEIPLFNSEEDEKAFMERAEKLIDSYHKPEKDKPNTRLDFVFGTKRICKTLVWACIFLYNWENGVINNNTERFTSEMQAKFGKKAVCDRTSLVRKANELSSHYAQKEGPYYEKKRLEEKKKRIANQKFLYVIEFWNSLKIESTERIESIEGIVSTSCNS